MSEGLLIFLCTQGFLFLSGLVGIYVKMTTKLRELEIRVGAVERQDNVIIAKLDAIMEDVTEIKVEMVNKQNRT
jgi:hypothetical protein